MTWIREKIKLPRSIRPPQRKQIAELVIAHILTRSAAGYDKNNKKFPKYTKEYAEKKGVGRGDVDLILTGEMMESIELLSNKPGEIIIGFEKGNDELNGKAEGNILGSYGNEPDPSKARDFLGIDEDELGQIITEIESQDFANEFDGKTLEEIKAIARELEKEVFG